MNIVIFTIQNCFGAQAGVFILYGWLRWKLQSIRRITFLLLPTWYTNFLFIHTDYIKLNSSTCFEHNPLIIRGQRRKLYICSLWYRHSLQVTVLCNR